MDVTIKIDQNYLLSLDTDTAELCVVCGDRASGEDNIKLHFHVKLTMTFLLPD